MSWKTVKLGDVLTESRIICEKPNPKTRIRVKLNVAGVEKRPNKNEVKGATNQFIRKAGQFIYGKQNFHKGAFGVIPPKLDGYETSADIPSFDVRKDCFPEWIFYYFKSGNRYLELEKLARGVGSKRIHPDQIYDIEIPLPSYNEQEKIINRIFDIEAQNGDLSTVLSHQLELVSQLRQAFLHEAMQGKLVSQDKADEPAAVLLEKIKAEKEKLIAVKKIKKQKPLPEINADEIKFEIPNNWTWCRLGAICDLITSGSRDWAKYYSKKGAKFVRMGNLSKNSFKLRLAKIQYVNAPQNSEGNRTRLEENDILVSITGEVGNLGMIPQDFGEAYINQHTGLVRLNKQIVPKFIANSFLSNLLQEQFNAPQRGLKNSFRLSDIDFLLIPLPPLAEQKRIVEQLEKLMEFCDELEANIRKSAVNSDSLLQVALKEALAA